MKYLILLLLTSCAYQNNEVRNIDNIGYWRAMPIIVDSLDKHPDSKYWQCEMQMQVLQDTTGGMIRDSLAKYNRLYMLNWLYGVNKDNQDKDWELSNYWWSNIK